jgi:hypothetical protein
MDLFQNAEVTPTKKNSFDPLKNLVNDYNVIEQFSLAIQQRDQRGLEFLLSDTQDSDYWKSKKDFISKYLNHCKKLERKHKQIFVTLIAGDCRGNRCGFAGCGGFTVSVNRMVNNKSLWNFNLLYRLDNEGKIILRRCAEFLVDNAQIP